MKAHSTLYLAVIITIVVSSRSNFGVLCGKSCPATLGWVLSGKVDLMVSGRAGQGLSRVGRGGLLSTAYRADLGALRVA